MESKDDRIVAVRLPRADATVSFPRSPFADRMSFPMPPSGPSSPAPLPDPPDEDHDLATPEETAARQRRRRWIIRGAVLAVVIVVGGFTGRPLLREIKGWQARRAAHEAARLLTDGQTEAGIAKLQDALSLRGSDPEVMRVAAVFLTRVGHGREAVSFWREIEKGRALTRDEQRDYATDFLQAGDPVEATRRLRLAVPKGTEGGPADWTLGMQIATRSRDAAGAVKLARRLLDDRSPAVTERQRLEAATLLLNVNDPASQEAGVAALRVVAGGGKSPESLDALLTLTRQAAQGIGLARAHQQAVPPTAVPELLKLAGQIEAHPKAEVAQKLLAIQARMVAQPEERAALLQGAIDRYGHGNDEELAALGAWLYTLEEPARVLEVISPARATGSRALYLQFLDALGAAGRWEDIQRSLEGHQFTLEPTIEQMYLARCATQLQQAAVAEGHWASALHAAGTHPDKLLALGRYAQNNAAHATAEAAFRAAIQATPESRQAYEALLGLLQEEGRTRDLLTAIQAMAALWPGDASVRNDQAYLAALLGENLPADRDTARELVRAEPASLPHRVTLALAELRLGHDLTALETLQAANPAAYAAQPRFQAVYAAALARTGNDADAAQVAATIPRNRLLPEEAQLLEGIKP